jgi:glycosyltransferase involved in cell wall biosynthesis
MPKPPAITVLMPVHNGALFLRESAASILQQTCADFEFLIINDGSTDATPDILAGLAAADARVRLAGGTERLGFSGALNRGLELARGEFIARMDADDIALPDRLQVQLDFLRAHTEVGLCGGRVVTFGLRAGSFHRPPLTAGETLCYALFDNPFAHPTVLFRRELFVRHGLQFDPAFCPTDDYELWTRCLRLFPCVNLDRVVLRYRIHGASMSEADWGEMDRHAARIATRELSALGLPADDEASRFHRSLGRGRCFPIHHTAELDRAAAWLRAILDANGRTHHYPDDTLARTCAEVWFRACFHAGAVGLAAMQRYAANPLRRARHTTPREWLALAGNSLLHKTT